MNFPTKKEIKKAKAGGIVQIDEEKFTHINDNLAKIFILLFAISLWYNRINKRIQFIQLNY